MKKKKIDKKEIEHLADLANIGLTEKEIKNYEKDLSRILDYIDKLNEVDVSDTEPVANVVGIENQIKEDKVTKKEAKREDILGQAPAREGDFIKTKPPIE